MGLETRFYALLNTPKSFNDVLLQFMVVFILFTIGKHLFYHTFWSMYYKGNSIFPRPLKWAWIDYLNWKSGKSQPMRMLEFVLKDPMSRSPEEIMKKLDRFGWEVEWHMSLGDAKAEIVRDIVKRVVAQRESPDPLTIVECGSYAGYSTLLLGSTARESDNVISIESNAQFSEISAKMCAMAGIRNVSFIAKPTAEAIQEIHAEVLHTKPVDILFLDHDKDDYLPTLRALESKGLIAKGSVIIADNVIHPGCPDFLIYVRTASKQYSCTLHPSHNAYEPLTLDGVEEIVRID